MHVGETDNNCSNAPKMHTQGRVESGYMVLVAYAGPMRPAAALRDSVFCLPTDIHSLLVKSS